MARKRGERGPGKDRKVRIGSLLDRTMLAVLKEGGEPLLDKDGNVQLDGKGRVIRRRISAATMNAIRARLKDVGANVKPLGGNYHDELVERAMARGARVDETPDPAGNVDNGPLPFPKPLDPFPVPAVGGVSE